MGFLFSQFSKPKGIIGKIVGWVMYKQNAQINEWTMSFLTIHPGECVLEIGFGPGYCVEEMCETYEGIRVIGIDPSEAMVDEAIRRNQKRVQNGQVHLIEGSAEEVRDVRGTIDKVISINNITYWEDPVGTLRSLREQMSLRGKVAIALQPHEKGASDQTTEIAGDQIRSFLEQAGFHHVCIHHKPDHPTKAVCVVGSVSDLPILSEYVEEDEDESIVKERRA